MKRALAHDKLAAAMRPLRDDRDVHVLRDVLVHLGRVGHVVVCPGGVYVIEPRRWRGSVTLRGGRLVRSGVGTNATIREVLEAATRIRRRLASCGVVRQVGAVIALTDTTLPDGPIDLRAVEVVEASMLPDWVRGRRRRMQPLEISAIVEALTPHDEVQWKPSR
jgi:hypothetical protein